MEVKAKLIKKVTNDGLARVLDDVQLGKVYMADWDSRERVEGYNTEFKRFWKREIVWMDNGKWYPTELLELME